MSFSIEVCLEYTGTTSLSNILYFYSNIDNYFSSFGSGLTSELLNGDCPYIIENIPDNTSIIKISDIETLCCFYKPTNITLTPTPTNSPTNTPTLSPTPTSTSIGPCFGYLYNLFSITGTNLNSITSDNNWSVATWNDFNTLSSYVGGSLRLKYNSNTGLVLTVNSSSFYLIKP